MYIHKLSLCPLPLYSRNIEIFNIILLSQKIVICSTAAAHGRVLLPVTEKKVTLYKEEKMYGSTVLYCASRRGGSRTCRRRGRQGANPSKGGANLVYLIIFLKNLMKLKKFWSGRGGAGSTSATVPGIWCDSLAKPDACSSFTFVLDKGERINYVMQEAFVLRICFDNLCRRKQ